MQHDDQIWMVLNNSFCSHLIKTTSTNLCRNEYNVNGQCSRATCPLANSNYATVREHEGKAYLYIKVIERAAFPAKLWEKHQLPVKYEEALEAIDTKLMFWPKHMIHRCKQRLTKITQYLIRMRKMATRRQSKIVTVPRKIERREKRREVKAFVAAKLDNHIERELLERLKRGTYGELYKFSETSFDKAFNGELETEQEMEEEYETEGRAKRKNRDAAGPSFEYVEDLEESDVSDLEDMASRWDVTADESDEEDEDDLEATLLEESEEEEGEADVDVPKKPTDNAKDSNSDEEEDEEPKKVAKKPTTGKGRVVRNRKNLKKNKEIEYERELTRAGPSKVRV